MKCYNQNPYRFIGKPRLSFLGSLDIKTKRIKNPNENLMQFIKVFHNPDLLKHILNNAELERPYHFALFVIFLSELANEDLK